MSCLRGLGTSWPRSRAGFETLGLFLSDVTGIQLCRLESPSSTVCAAGGARHQPLEQGWARDTHYGWAICHCWSTVTVTAVPLSSSPLCHGHCHCCVMVTLVTVQYHCHCCATFTVTAVPGSPSSLCHSHYCPVPSIPWIPPFPSLRHPPPSPSSIILILTSGPPAQEPPWLHPNLTSLPSPPHPAPRLCLVWHRPGQGGCKSRLETRAGGGRGSGQSKHREGRGGCVRCESPRPPRPRLARTQGRPHAPERGQAAARAHRGAPGKPGPAGAATHGGHVTPHGVSQHGVCTACHAWLACNGVSPQRGVVARLPGMSCDWHACHTFVWRATRLDGVSKVWRVRHVRGVTHVWCHTPGKCGVPRACVMHARKIRPRCVLDVSQRCHKCPAHLRGVSQV